MVAREAPMSRRGRAALCREENEIPEALIPFKQRMK